MDEHESGWEWGCRHSGGWRRRRAVRSAVWGVFLVALGTLLLVARFGPWQLPGFWELWPLLLFVLAAIRLIEGRVGGAVTMTGLGSWFLAVESNWHGLTWGNSWPLALVAVGLGMVVRALTGEDRRRLRRLGVDLG